MRRVSSLFVLLCLLLSSCNPNGSVATGPNPALLKAKLDSLHKVSGLSGLSTAIIHDGEIALVVHEGYADASQKTPITDDTLFEAASLSKVVFAYIVLQLVDQGVLELDKPLLSYVDDTYLIDSFLNSPLEDVRFRKITLLHVLSHRTGLPNWRNRLTGEPLEFRREPGMRFGYSGEGFMMAQRVVESVTEKPLEQLAKELVFEPLEMTDSSFSAGADMLERLALQTNGMGESRPHRFEGSIPAMAAASLVTTASDFARFVTAISKGERLSESSHKDFFTPQSSVGEDGESNVHWGMGVGLAGNTPDAPIWHWGDNGGAKAFFYLDRVSGDGVVYFSNDQFGLSIYRPMMKIANLDPEPLEDCPLLGYSAWDTPTIRMARLLRKNDTEGALELHRLLMEDQDSNNASERQVNFLGYMLLNADRFEDAIKVFTINTEFFADSANTWDSLGEAYWRAGRLEEAREHYQRALDIDPEFPSALRALERIEEELSGNNQ